jgi:F-type H+-transporting ATPase subunit delta
MAELTTLARPYAKAAFEYAREHDALGQWSQELALAAAVSADARLARQLASPSQTAAEQVALLVRVCDEQLSAPLRNFLAVLADNKRLALLPQIAVLFEAMRAAHERAVEVELVSAYELDEAVTQRLRQALEKKLERSVKLRSTTDASLLGGVLIRAGDLVIDGSVRGRLNKLAAAMNS